jgi:hypothetical protein
MAPPALLSALMAVSMTSSHFAVPTSEGGATTAAHVEALVQACGYASGPVTRAAADPPGSLPWLVPLERGSEPLMFFVRDAEDVGRVDGRLFAVLVFPDTAGAERLYAAARSKAAESGPSVSVASSAAFLADSVTRDRGPALVRGGSLTVWRDTVAALQLTAPAEPSALDIALQLSKHGAELATATPEQVRRAVELARTDLKPRSRDDLTTSPYGVDRDFVECLDSR